MFILKDVIQSDIGPGRGHMWVEWIAFLVIPFWQRIWLWCHSFPAKNPVLSIFAFLIWNGTLIGRISRI